MRLADFIESNTDEILAEWVTFAEAYVKAGMTMSIDELRDHAVEMFKIIIADLRTSQTDDEQTEKSKGNAETELLDTAAEVHGAGRAESGFTHAEMVSEYRALRASVIRLWTKEQGTLTGPDFDDLIRFNEAIDQALAESVTRYTKNLDQSKEMFIAILGHDLRAPLGAIMTSSQFMLATGELVEPHLALTNGIARSSKRMSQMVGDLLDFTSSRLGSGVPIARAPMDMETVARDAVEEMADAEPESLLQLHTSGDLHGSWDAARISQVLSNLLGNAVQHGKSGTIVHVSALGEGDEVVLRVHNRGRAIATEDLAGLFSPLKRLRSGDGAVSDERNLGLGLYIAERIVTAHQGTIDVKSSVDDGTEFIVKLPRE